MNAENPLVVVRGNHATTNSLLVAEMFGKRHDDVLKAIRSLLTDLPEGDRRNFAEIFFEDSYGRKQPAYEMTRDGFSLLAMGFTGKKALEWKVKFLKAFNLMEDSLNGKRSLPWKEAVATFQELYTATRLMCGTKSKAVFAANAAAKSMTGVDLLELTGLSQDFSQHDTTAANETFLNGLVLLLDGDNLTVRGTFKEIIDSLALILSPESRRLLPTPHTFRRQLERIRQNLEMQGVAVVFGKLTAKGYTVELTRQQQPVATVCQLAEYREAHKH